MKFNRLLKYLAFLVLILTFGFLYGFSLKRNVKKKIDEINIQIQENNVSFLNRSMVNKLLIQNDTTVKNFQKSVIDLYSLEERVINNPYVEEAAVFFTIDGVLKTKVKQREPIARVITKKEIYYIDKQGVEVPLSNVYSARVLLVTGIENKKEIDEVLPLLDIVLNDDFLKKEIISIHKSAFGDYQFSARSGDYKIDFGKLTNVNLKFEKLKAFYNKTFLDKTIEKYKTINLKYHNQVVCAK